MPTTLTVQADFTDQTGIFDPRKLLDDVTLIGCGGIGASALPTLATLGIRRLTLWDPDLVEPRNVASQLLFYPDDIGRPKVEVAEERLRLYGAEQVTVHQELFDATEHAVELEGIVISGVDSMAARQNIWEAVRDNGLVTRLIDGRIGGEIYTLIVIDPMSDEHVSWYEQFQLHGDAQAMPLPCTERAVVYPAVALGAHMAAAFACLQRGDSVPTFRQENMRTGEVVKIQM